MAAFVHTDQDQDFQVDDSLAGQLVSFRLRRVYGARQETITSSGSAPSWHGDVKVVAEPIANLNLSARYSRQHRKMDGSALISALFTQVVSFANRPADDIAELNQATTFWERDDDRYELQFNRRFAKSWGIKGGWNRLERDSRIEADISQIVIPGQQDGHHQRNIDRYNLGAYYRKSNLKLDLELRQERGDRSILRTDFLDRQSYRVKAHLDLAENLVLRASLRGADYDNLSAEAGFDGSEVQYNVSLDVIGKKGVDLQVNYSAYNLKQENILTYPQDLSQVPLLHRENGDSFEGHMDWRLKRWNININLARYENKGALPYNMEWGRLRTEYLLSESFRTIFELNKRQYRENLALADYSGVGYAFFLRWRN